MDTTDTTSWNSTALAQIRSNGTGRPVLFTNRSVVLERTVGAPAGGSAIGLEAAVFERVTGVPAGSVPVVRGNWLSAAWGQVRAVLLDAARQQPLIDFREGVAARSVLEPSKDTIAVTTDSGAVTGDVLIGADGGRSVVRRYVVPEQPLARYAGYVIWRAPLDEREVPGGVGDRGDVMEFFSTASARLTVYCVPAPTAAPGWGNGGSRSPGTTRDGPG